MEDSLQQKQVSISLSGTRRKSHVVEPYLRLQNKATTWSSKSESDLTRLVSCEDEEVGEKLEFNSPVPSYSESSKQSQSVRCRARKQAVEVITESPHCCVAKRRNSSIPCFETHQIATDNQDYTVMKARARIKSTENVSVDICNGYAVPFPVVSSGKTRSVSVVEYGNIPRVKPPSDRKISVSSEPANICQCVGKQKFIEGHYKATYVCDIRTGERKEDDLSPERCLQKVDSDRKTQPNLQSSSSPPPTENKNQEFNESTIKEERNKKYDSLPTPSARKLIPAPPVEEKGPVYSNFLASNCEVHRSQVLDKDSHYGNCTCVEYTAPEESPRQRIHSRRASRASSTSSTFKWSRDAGVPSLSELCVRVLVNSVSTSTLFRLLLSPGKEITGKGPVDVSQKNSKSDKSPLRMLIQKV